MNYKNFKDKVLEYKPQILYAGATILVFVLGYGTGKGLEQAKWKSKQAALEYPNYTTSKGAGANKEAEGDTSNLPGATTAVAQKDADPKCIIKGNISSKNKKIYHVASGRFYKTVKPEQCFATEEAAKQAGFKKSGL